MIHPIIIRDHKTQPRSLTFTTRVLFGEKKTRPDLRLLSLDSSVQITCPLKSTKRTMYIIS